MGPLSFGTVPKNWEDILLTRFDDDFLLSCFDSTFVFVSKNKIKDNDIFFLQETEIQVYEGGLFTWL